MNRERFVEWQARLVDETFALTAGEEAGRAHFEQLTLDTYDFMVSAGLVALPFSAMPGHAGNFLTGYAERDLQRRWPNLVVPADLAERWEDWNREAHRLLERNPRLELREKLQDINESHMAASWPAGYEHLIQAWVDAGDPTAPPPFEDGRGVATSAFFNRLRELRRLCGGWLYWDEHIKRVVFVPEPEWQRICAVRQAAEAKRQTELEASKARLKLREQRLQDIVASARADANFWEALRAWERACEAKGLAGLQPVLVVARLGSPKRPDILGPDPIFADFVARVGLPDDVLTAADIVTDLRGEMRRELGLKGVFGWPIGRIGIA
jgi:hypothetical protein